MLHIQDAKYMKVGLKDKISQYVDFKYGYGNEVTLGFKMQNDASDNFSTREEYEEQMRKYDEMYKTLSEIMERADKRIEEERRNGTIQTSAEDDVLKLLSGHKLKIYKYVIKNECITTRIAMGVLGLKERRSRKILAEMCEEGYLRRIGATSNLKYVRNNCK